MKPSAQKKDIYILLYSNKCVSNRYILLIYKQKKNTDSIKKNYLNA